jgi:hypothetical protein
MKFIQTYESFLNEASAYEVISGADFKKQYLSTSSGDLEKAYFGNQEVSMGAVLGKGTYYSVSSGSSDHYESDDDYTGTDYFGLADNAKIMLVPDAQIIGGSKIQATAKKLGADGAYDPTEGQGGPYLGLVIYNSKVIQ